MRISRVAFITALASRRVTSFSTTHSKFGTGWRAVSHQTNNINSLVQQQFSGRTSSNRRYLSSGGFDGEQPQIAQIGMEQMEEIIEDLVSDQRLQ